MITLPSLPKLQEEEVGRTLLTRGTPYTLYCKPWTAVTNALFVRHISNLQALKQYGEVQMTTKCVFFEECREVERNLEVVATIFYKPTEQTE